MSNGNSTQGQAVHVDWHVEFMDETWRGPSESAGDGCDDAVGSGVAQVRSGLDLPVQFQTNSVSGAKGSSELG